MSEQEPSPAAVLDPDDPFYDAFKRHDQYGTRGRAPQPWWEYVRLALLGAVLVPLRFTAILLLVLGYHFVCRLSFLFPPENRAGNVVALGKVAARLALLAFGFWRVAWTRDARPPRQLAGEEKGAQPLGEGEGAGEAPAVGAIVSNHISYVDILVHMTHSFPSFVARGNTVSLPLVGLISQHLQCIYVDREFKKGDVKGVAGQVKARAELAAGGAAPPDLRPLLLFPEGTTTNGECLLPFKTGAFLAGAPVQPVLLRYGPSRVSPAWESIDPVWHAFLMLATPFHSVTATELPVYVPSREERADPKLYAANVREMMLRAGGLRPSEASLVDSRAYIALKDGKAPPAHSRAGVLLAERGEGQALGAGDHIGGAAGPRGPKKAS